MDVDTQSRLLRRIEELWFDDGNIVIQAGDALYRVYRGTLAMHSSVFKDMLSFPQPANAELFDGLPLVRLPDSEVEVTLFLKALLIPTFFEPYPSQTDFLTIYACLRLSNKYDVEFVRKRGIIHLACHYSTTLKEFDSVVDKLSWTEPLDPAYLICAVSLAREIDAPWMLPTVFYGLASCLIELGPQIFHGTEYEGLKCSLGMDDQKRFLEGMHAQISRSGQLLDFLSRADDEPCGVYCSGDSLRLHLFRSIQVFMDKYSHRPLMIWVLGDWESFESDYPDYCTACVTKLKERHLERRQTFWEELPAIYGLPGWDKLREKRAAAIGPDAQFY
ncbi:hypothetical protein C8F01DRAFT_987061 [Mycena amicta]|nr:hypothetical protein C8F01DRAFT_987061 [Mycena amicta]